MSRQPTARISGKGSGLTNGKTRGAISDGLTGLFRGGRPIDDALEDAPAALVMRGSLSGISAAVAVEMDVGGVKHSQGSS